MAFFPSQAFDLDKIVRPNIKELTPYRCARDDYSDGILLDANENSLGPPITRPEAFQDMEFNRYPDPLHMDLKEKIGAYRNVKPEQIFLGVGSDEAIDLLIRIFCSPREDQILITPPTYGMYKVCAKVNDVAVKSVALTPSFEVDIPLTLQGVDDRTKLLFLCSPGNPTSRSIPLAAIQTIAQTLSTTIVVVDEAYIDFVPSWSERSAVGLLSVCPNLVVLQTLSKAFGLAGIRLGMAYGSPAIVQYMNNVKAPYNINGLTYRTALAAFTPQGLQTVQRHIDELIIQRSLLMAALHERPQYVSCVYPAEANFVLFRCTGSKAQQLYKTMADRGVVCRYRGNEMHCEECLRVTVGTAKENEEFLKLFDIVCRELLG